MEACGAEPPLFRIGDHQTASCFLYDRQPQVAQEQLSELLPA
jgi:peptide/nickel transport system ATP-binding protein